MKKIVLLTALLCLFIAFQSVFAQDPTPPTFKTNLYYNGYQQIFVEDIGKGGSDNEEFIFYDESKDAWGNKTDDLPRGHLPGEYQVQYCLSTTGSNKCSYSVQTVTVTINEVDPPKAKERLIYNGGEYLLIEPGIPLPKNQPNDVYYYRITSPASERTDWRESPDGTDYAIPRAKGPGTYTVEYILLDKGSVPAENVKGKPLEVTIGRRESYNPPSPTGSGSSGSSGSSHYSFYTIGDGSALFDTNKNLPATGFPTRISKPLSIKPDTISYEDLSMRIQIPSISVDVELTGVPVIGDTWAVEWLGEQAGMLSGSAMPGEGYTMVAAHNHLNTQEIGPFAFLFDLDENDRIFVNMPDGGLKIYSVYANELLEPNDFSQIASISENEDGSLILVTCENEMTDGRYQNRRVVFAKLMN